MHSSSFCSHKDLFCAGSGRQSHSDNHTPEGHHIDTGNVCTILRGKLHLPCMERHSINSARSTQAVSGLLPSEWRVGWLSFSMPLPRRLFWMLYTWSPKASRGMLSNEAIRHKEVLDSQEQLGVTMGRKWLHQDHERYWRSWIVRTCNDSLISIS